MKATAFVALGCMLTACAQQSTESGRSERIGRQAQAVEADSGTTGALPSAGTRTDGSGHAHEPVRTTPRATPLPAPPSAPLCPEDKVYSPMWSAMQASKQRSKAEEAARVAALPSAVPTAAPGMAAHQQRFLDLVRSKQAEWGGLSVDAREAKYAALKQQELGE